ncbi:MAG: toxic anion resistance protein [Turicibacter sp.]|nr:toxic anion resistance protein [Turicibacter sp.]
MNELLTIDQQEEVINDPNQLKMRLRNTEEVKQIAKNIDVQNQISLLEVGKQPAEQISSFANRVLGTMQSSSMEESSKLLGLLGKIMDRFDAKDFAEEKPGFLARMFGKGKNMIDKIFEKYQTMGGEIDKVYVEIKKYENEMKNSTVLLDQLYNENFNYLCELEKYIVALEMKVEDLRATALPELEAKVQSGDQMANFELDTLHAALELMEQRIYDLEMAKQVSFQTAPQIRMLQRGNTKLIAKINSAFVTTIPIFKNSLIQAVAAKRQKLVADSMAELDKRTNEMLLKNATNIANQSKDIARLAGAPSVKLETMEQTWSIIMNGLQETKAIEDENARNRELGRKRLQELQQQYLSAKGNTISR